MLFPEVADAIADLIVMTAQARSRSLPQFINSLNPADAAVLIANAGIERCWP